MGASHPPLLRCDATAMLRQWQLEVVKRISTRVFHPGRHALELQIDGVAQGKAEFDLAFPS
jgi:hypothetical protein